MNIYIKMVGENNTQYNTQNPVDFIGKRNLVVYIYNNHMKRLKDGKNQ